MTWIKCTDRLPPYEEIILAFSTYEGVCCVIYRKGDYFSPHIRCYQCEMIYDVTHWMSIPARPEDA